MIKIKYNISKNKKIDMVKFFIYCLVLVVISILFLTIGISNLSTKDKKFREEKERQEQYRTKSENISRKTKKYNKEIRTISRKWRNQVRFSNSLISNKAFNVIGKLNIIEDLLPEGVYIKGISLTVDSKSKIEFTVVSDSYSHLFEVYTNFSKFNPVIMNEWVSEGIFNSKINLSLISEE